MILFFGQHDYRTGVTAELVIIYPARGICGCSKTGQIVKDDLFYFNKSKVFADGFKIGAVGGRAG
jgi:hypothetical protein